MTSIYNLSWDRVSFLDKLYLFFKSRKREKEKMQLDDRQVQAQGYSALSSTYYSIAGTGFSRLKGAFRPLWFAPIQIAIWCFTWLPLTVWCYWRMLPLSNRVVELVGYGRMSAAQCDIRQSILRRRGNYDEASDCIYIAFGNEPEAHTIGLLHIGLAEVYRHKGDWENAEFEVKMALAAAEKIEKQDPRQAIRIYRHCADITDFVEEGDPIPGSQLRRKAKSLAVAIGAQDQLIKL